MARGTIPGPTADRVARWPHIPLGATLILVKLAPDGHETTRYPGTVIEAGAPPPWVAIESPWTHRAYDLDGLLLVPGDTLHEFFSPADWFNLFSVFAPDGTLRGWYANVTYPARLDVTTDPWTLYWHDLYLDVVALSEGKVVVRDENELAEAGLATADPTLYTRIIAARDELLARCRVRAFPFHESNLASPDDGPQRVD